MRKLKHPGSVMGLFTLSLKTTMEAVRRVLKHEEGRRR